MRENGDHEGVMSQHGARLVLSLLAIADGRTQKELADITRLRPPTVSVILRRMAEEGMVEIKSSES
ncbi:MAG: MarR family transcriptional regulator, partial [Clostridia bacterium]|nr:MarR family transcriptional regulator [Clostridia bacterium]